MPDVELTRVLRYNRLKPMRGSDVVAAKRMTYKQLAAATGNGAWWKKYISMRPRVRSTFGPRFKKDLIRAQAQLGVKKDGVFGPKTLAAMVKKGRVDAIVEQLLEAAGPSEEEKRFNALMAQCKLASDLTPGYLLGGGHGVDLDSVSYSQRLDCSSSSSKVLHESGMFGEGPNAIVSGLFAQRYGVPGKGEFFTIYANHEHIFIRFHKGPYWRLDTSPQGDGGRGPKLRRMPRFTFGFAQRHWPGM